MYSLAEPGKAHGVVASARVQLVRMRTMNDYVNACATV